jgi:hypothetical protein
MQKLRTRACQHQGFDVFQRGDQRVQIMPVDRANVVKAKFLKQGGGHHHAFGMLFKALGQLEQWRRAFEHGFAYVACRGIKLAAHQLGQIAVQRAYGRADAHVVVVQHYQEGHIVLYPSVIQRLKSHTSGHGAVANDGHAVARLTLGARADGHAQGG